MRVIGREILIINVQVYYLIKETWIHKAHRNVRNDWVARLCKKGHRDRDWERAKGVS